MKTGMAVTLVLLLVATGCGSDSGPVATATTMAPARTLTPAGTAEPTTTVATVGTTEPVTTVAPATSAPATSTPATTTAPVDSEPVWTSESTWDVCLVTGPEGRKYEWLNHATWMSLERQRREIARSLYPDGGATTERATPGEAGDRAALITGFVEARCDLVVTIGAEAGDATAAEARRNPDVDFIGINQHHDADLPNLAGLVFEEDRAGFLIGVLAASATVTGIVAVILDSATDPSSVGYRTGFTNGVAHVDPGVEVLTIAHPGEGGGTGDGSEVVGEPDAAWGAAAANQALDGGADVVFSPGDGSGRGALEEVAGTGYDGRNGALCIGAEADDFMQVIKARRCMLTGVHSLPNEFHDRRWNPVSPPITKQFEDALGVPDAYDREHAYSTLALIGREFFVGGNPSGTHQGPIGLSYINRWGAHKKGVPNRSYSPSDELLAMLADLTGALWRGEVTAS